MPVFAGSTAARPGLGRRAGPVTVSGNEMMSAARAFQAQGWAHAAAHAAARMHAKAAAGFKAAVFAFVEEGDRAQAVEAHRLMSRAFAEQSMAEHAANRSRVRWL